MDKKVLFNEIYPLLKGNDEIMATDEKDVLIFPESEEDLKYTEGFYIKDIIAHDAGSITVVLYEKEGVE